MMFWYRNMSEMLQPKAIPLSWIWVYTNMTQKLPPFLLGFHWTELPSNYLVNYRFSGNWKKIIRTTNFVSLLFATNWNANNLISIAIADIFYIDKIACIRFSASRKCMAGIQLEEPHHQFALITYFEQEHYQTWRLKYWQIEKANKATKKTIIWQIYWNNLGCPSVNEDWFMWFVSCHMQAIKRRHLNRTNFRYSTDSGQQQKNSVQNKVIFFTLCVALGAVIWLSPWKVNGFPGPLIRNVTARFICKTTTESDLLRSCHGCIWHSQQILSFADVKWTHLLLKCISSTMSQNRPDGN